MAGSARSQWRVSESVLEFMTPELARDLLVECFADARLQDERGRGDSWSMDVRLLRETAARTVRAAFTDLGYDFNAPDAASCRMVLEQLTRDSRVAGTSAEIVEHHVREYARVIDALERRGRASGSASC